MTMFGSQWLANAGSGYEISQSIRFNDDDSAHMARDGFGQSPTSSTDCTISVWVKRGNNLGSNSTIFYGGDPNGSTSESLRFGTGDQLQFSQASSDYDLKTNQLFRDPSAWYHIVAVLDTDNGTEGNRAALYVNGSKVTSFATENYPGSSYSTNFTANSSSVEHVIGSNAAAGNASQFFDGYIAEFNFIDGQVLTPASFGETNDDGVWIPKKYSGAYGNNGFFIDGRDSSDLGDDESGNGNDLAGSGLAAADQKSDTPTLNASTFNPLWAGATLSDGNLVATASGNAYQWATSTFAIDDGGKYVCEFQKSAGTFGYVGIFQIGNHNATTGNNYMYGYNLGTGEIVKNSSVVTDLGTGAANSLMRIEYDGSNDTIKIFDDGAEIFPASTGVSNTVGLTGQDSLHFGCAPYASGTIITATFQGLSGTPTADFKELTSANLATPSITDGSAYFHTQLYTGNGSSGLAITNDANAGDFQPDFLWLAPRSNGDNHVLFGSVRGTTSRIYSNKADPADVDGTAQITFETDGFDLDTTDPNYNGSGRTYVAWQWKANGSGSSNEDGSLSSTVSANQTAGFSIVTATPGTSGTDTIGHGLGIAPKMIIGKNTNLADNWHVYHSTISPATEVRLNSTSAATTTTWESASTSSVFQIKNGSWTNGSQVCLFYCFAEIPGYSSFGSYTGNGSADGPFVYCGFKPSWLMIKRSSGGTGNWDIFDNKRDPFNVVDAVLDADNTTSETTYSTIKFDFLSNGFKVRETQSNINNSGDTYIYMAFAEHPFGGDDAAPATAR